MTNRLTHHHRLALLMLCAGWQAHAAPVALPSYNIDTSGSSVSGLSSGGFMAAQLHVAFSDTFKAGAGIVAGGPYFCAQGLLSTAFGPCMAASASSKPATAALIATTDSWASQGLIDATGNLAAGRVYLYSGSIDSTVKPLVMHEANAYYQHYIGGANIFFKKNLPSEHAMVTDDFGNGCGVKASPYISDCDFDLAGEMLKWIYGGLNPRNNGALGGSFVEYKQAEFIADPASHGMASSGWAYVPAACGAGRVCKLHVVLHGCQQDPTRIQDQYVRGTGYNRWADSNGIVVLYPQAAASSAGNPNGCWDWWGYDDPDYAKKSGRQMAAIKAMVDRVSGAPAPPTPPTPPGFVCTATLASNFAHWAADRAVNQGPFALARGSNQNMGWLSTFVKTRLAQTAQDYYVVGDCP
ncbi:extracellular catalytic domain type 2 short-chain-length polyhydroxyalkanoate depolymerase [Pseudoduganella namucuonensis]|uniref:Esterase PHB depolymerase n=1 Tax=Pseudoduganella namucuonensis TaxID=1035707 RepID=A0A1I7F0S5_9BURK|nr:PHB depolymerase family esterase [Pseudoduganella namucuonensis]SFU29786.1 Esterase PHB depolymerase [Pseudoduganella namucuonensis]